MSSSQTNRHLFTVLVSSLPRRERTSPAAAVAVFTHVIVVGAAVWMTKEKLPTEVERVDRVSFAAGDSVTNIMLIAHDVGGSKFKATRRATTVKKSSSLPHGTQPAVTDAGIDHQLAVGRDSLRRAIFGFSWAMPSVPRKDTVTAAPTIEELSSAPRFTAYTLAPVMKNMEQIQRFLGREFPRKLRRDGGDARAILWLLIDMTGQVHRAVIRETSGRGEVDSLAVKASKLMRFEPAKQAGRPVPVWVQQPVRFHVVDVPIGY